MKKIKTLIDKPNVITIFFMVFDFIISFVGLLLSHFHIIFYVDNNLTIGTSLAFITVNSLLILIMFIVFKVYKMLTSQLSIIDSLKIFTIAILTFIISYIIEEIIHLTNRGVFYCPYWYNFILASIAISFLLTSERIFARLIYWLIRQNFHEKHSIKTAIIGAGQVAKFVCDEMLINPMSKNHVVVLVDDDKNKIGKSFYGKPVEGPISNIKEIVTKYNVETVIIAISSLDQDSLKNIIHYLKDCPVRIRRAPLLSEMEGPYDHKIHDVNLEDLLGRDPIILDNSKVYDMLHQKVVLVTGAGGSIGSELVRQIFAVHPKTLVLFDIYENSTYDIQMELLQIMRKEMINDIELITLIGATYNFQRMEDIISKYKPDYIYHAAAYKHVPLMEDSPEEAVRTNIIGTYNVAFLADKYKVKKMVLVSTDKAVRPTNIMGATKKVAEEIIQYFSSVSKFTIYAAVRFGNVLGSNGSVVPLFKKQILAGGPITLTDKRIIRYFMTIKEAVSLILQCGLFASEGEIFILDMGEPVKILSLAEMLIRQAGLRPDVDIKIIETGLRPGEKLYEELLLDKNKHKKTENNLIYIEDKDERKEIKEFNIKRFEEMTNKKDIKLKSLV